jgi:hypothetical protein
LTVWILLAVTLAFGNIRSIQKGEENEMEIPKAMIVEKIRSRSGAEMANQADEELPDKLDTETDAELLSKYDIDPDELHEEHGGQSPAAT